MKKLGILIIVVLLCAVGWGGATYVVGGKVESHYFGLLDQYGQWGPLALTNQGYQRGLVSSRATTLLELTLPQPAEQYGQEPSVQTVQMLFEHDLRHGPLLFGAGPDGQGFPSSGLALVETRPVRLSGSDAELEELFQKFPELRDAIATVAVDFDGSSNTLLQIPPFERQEDGDRITWGGLTFTMDYAPGEGTLRGDMEMPSMTFRTGESAMTWNGISGRFDMVEALPALYVGTSQGIFEGMDLTLPRPDGEDRRVMQVERAEFVSDSRFEGGLVELNQVMTLGGITVDGEHYGPLVLDVDMRNLDGQALSEMQQQARDVYLGANSFTPDEIAAELIPVYTLFFTKLMAGKPEMNIKRLHVGTPMGEADGTFRIRMTGLTEVPLESPAALLPALQYLDAALDVAVDESLVRTILAGKLEDSLRRAAEASPRAAFSDEEIAMMVEGQVRNQLEMWAAQNFILRDGDKIRTRATFKEGELTVNGKPLRLFGG